MTVAIFLLMIYVMTFLYNYQPKGFPSKYCMSHYEKKIITKKEMLLNESIKGEVYVGRGKEIYYNR